MFELSMKKSRLAEDESAQQQISRIVGQYNGSRGSLIAILEKIQSEHGYLSEQLLHLVAEKTGKTLVDVYGVATFYNLFNLEPRGEHLVSVCLGTACHVRNSNAVVEEFEKQLKIKVGETTPDRLFTLKTVNCLGACALGPVAVIDGHYFSKLNRSSVGSLIEKASKGLTYQSANEDIRVFPVGAICPACGKSLMDESFPIEEHPSIKFTISYEDKKGWLRLSSLYGRFDTFCDHDIPFDTVVDFYCPHCEATLIGSWKCERCETPMAQMKIPGGGVMRICSRRGCYGSESHILDLA